MSGRFRYCAPRFRWALLASTSLGTRADLIDVLVRALRPWWAIG